MKLTVGEESLLRRIVEKRGVVPLLYVLSKIIEDGGSIARVTDDTEILMRSADIEPLSRQLRQAAAFAEDFRGH